MFWTWILPNKNNTKLVRGARHPFPPLNLIRSRIKSICGIFSVSGGHVSRFNSRILLSALDALIETHFTPNIVKGLQGEIQMLDYEELVGMNLDNPHYQ